MSLVIAGHKIGDGAPCFVIAEAGVNHNGDLAMAKRLVDAARTAGADAVKFQTFHAEKVIAPIAPKAAYQKQTTGADESQLDMVKKLELPFTAFQELADYCRQAGIMFLSTPFDHQSVDDLERLGVPAYKVPSGEITNFPLLEHVARKGKPIVLSTGMSELDEVRTAVEALRAAGNKQLALLHCVSNYPAAASSVNLRAMDTMRDAFGVPVGYSDHTMGSDIPIMAAAMGASIIEKHLTLDCNLPGPDHKASLEPADFGAMVRGIRRPAGAKVIDAALGDGRKRRMPEEEDVARVARRSLVAACLIPAGTALTIDNVGILRPGTGLPPRMRSQVLGRRAKIDIAPGDLLTLEMLA